MTQVKQNDEHLTLEEEKEIQESYNKIVNSRPIEFKSNGYILTSENEIKHVLYKCAYITAFLVSESKNPELVWRKIMETPNYSNKFFSEVQPVIKFNTDNIEVKELKNTSKEEDFLKMVYSYSSQLNNDFEGYIEEYNTEYPVKVGASQIKVEQKLERVINRSEWMTKEEEKKEFLTREEIETMRSLAKDDIEELQKDLIKNEDLDKVLSGDIKNKEEETEETNSIFTEAIKDC